MRGYFSTGEMKWKCGWTDFLIGLLLGPPDDTAEHPRFGSELRFYKRTRVLAAERKKEFITDLQHRGVNERKTKQASSARAALHDIEMERARRRPVS
jgi:hypothetical protein